ncbi:MFS transporter [Arcobacter sp. YIC-464]|uniref:MFS transporter n=1 Tax=Arcobacter sp. YIC-464 TaxID=3376631 RepID=UPI003C1E197B
MTNKRVLNYGVLAIPIAILGMPLYIYLPTFYVQDIGLNTALVAALLFFARLLDMFADPFIGNLSDRYFSKKSLIVIGAFSLLISFYFLINPFNNYPTFSLIFFSIITYISWSLINIPYLALNATIGKNSFDNSKLSFSREIFTIIGVLVALLIPFLFNASSDSKRSLELIFYVLVFVLPLVLVFFALNIKEQNSINITISFKDSIKSFYEKFKEQKNLFFAFIINNLANAIPATLFLFYVQYYLKTPQFTGALLILYFLSAIIAVPFWLNFSKKIGKRKTWIISMAFASFFFCLTPFLNEGDYIKFAFITFFTGLCLGADMALPSSIQADIAQNSKKLGKEISGTLFGFWAMLTKLALALAVFITFTILELVSFDIDNPTNFSLFILSILYSILPVILKIISIILIAKNKV